MSLTRSISAILCSDRCLISTVFCTSCGGRIKHVILVPIWPAQTLCFLLDKPVSLRYKPCLTGSSSFPFIHISALCSILKGSPETYRFVYSLLPLPLIQDLLFNVEECKQFRLFSHRKFYGERNRTNLNLMRKGRK